MNRVCHPRHGERCLRCRTAVWYADVFHDPTAGLWLHQGCGDLRKCGRISAKCEGCGRVFCPPEVLPFVPLFRLSG